MAANHLLSRANDALQSALVLGSVPDDDGGGEDGLNGRCRSAPSLFLAG